MAIAVAAAIVGVLFGSFGVRAVIGAVKRLPEGVKKVGRKLGRAVLKAWKPVLAVLAAAGLVALLLWRAKEDNNPKRWAETIAAVVLLALTLLCWLARRKVWEVTEAFEHEESGTKTKYVPHQRLSESEYTKLTPAEQGKLRAKRERYLRSLYVGADGRWSTSKTQALLWTYVVLFGLIALFVADYLDLDLSGAAAKDEPGRQGFGDIELRPEYLLLLGGPFAAAIMARGLVSTKLQAGQIVKPNEADDRNTVNGLRDLISNDAGNADLIDFQYLCFNLVALAVVMFELVPDLQNGFPEIPDFLLALTSAAALAYVTKKAVERSMPAIVRLAPAKAFPGDALTIEGRYLVAPPNRKPSVTVDGHVATVTSVSTGVGGDDATVTVTVPKEATAGTGKSVSVYPEGATTPASSTDLEILESSVAEVSPEKIVLRPNEQVVVKGTGFGAEQGGVKLGDLALVVSTWSDKQVVAFVPAFDPEKVTPGATQLALVVTSAAGASSTPKMMPVEGVRIDGVDPLPLPVAAGTELTISGGNFGATQGANGGVALAGAALTPTRWSDTLVVARLDEAAGGSGKPLQLRLTNALGLSAVTSVEVKTP